jgi:hypothetical protein
MEFNPAAERVFGFRREQAPGQPLAGLIISPPLRKGGTRPGWTTTSQLARDPCVRSIWS